MSEAAMPIDRPAAYMGVGGILTPLLISAGLSAVLLVAVGMNLGLFFGGIVLVTLLTPGLVLAEEHIGRRAMALGAVVLPVAAAWLTAVFGPVGLGAWAAAVALLIAYALAVAGLACALEWTGLPRAFAAGITILLAMLWLAWPIWLAPWVHDANLVARLILPHPLLVLNGILREAYPVPWAQHVLAYRLTTLGDNIPYTLPRGVGWGVGVHLVIAVAVGSWLLVIGSSRRGVGGGG